MKNLSYILLVLSLISCSKSEVVKEPERVYTKALDTTYTPRVVDTIEITNIPIGFDVYLEDWNTEYYCFNLNVSNND